MRLRRTAVSVIASIALHLAIGALLLWHQAPPPPAPEPRDTVISIDVRELPPEKAPHDAKAMKSPGSRGAGHSAVAQAPAASSPSSGGPEPAAPQSGGDPGPRVTALLPRPDVLGAPGPSAGEPAHGRTIWNDGKGDGPKGSSAAEGLAIKERLDGWIRDDMADMRVADGNIDDYFVDLRKDLEKNAKLDMKAEIRPQDFLANAAREYQHTLEQYGRSGSPGGVAALGPAGADPGGSQRDRDIAADRFARMDELLHDAYGGELVAIVELRQGSDGHFIDSVLLKPSGNKVFDAHALGAAPSAASVEVPARVTQAHPEGLHTVWEFRGKLQLRKSLKKIKVKDPGELAYYASMGLLSAFTGVPFDETTGEVWILDLANPKIQCRVQLLRVY